MLSQGVSVEQLLDRFAVLCKLQLEAEAVAGKHSADLRVRTHLLSCTPCAAQCRSFPDCHPGASSFASKASLVSAYAGDPPRNVSLARKRADSAKMIICTPCPSHCCSPVPCSTGGP